MVVQKFLDEFSKYDETNRLMELSSEELTISIDAIPENLIPFDKTLILILSNKQKDRLIAKLIDVVESGVISKNY